MNREELLDDAVKAYEQSTGDTPDTRDFVALQDAVDDYIKSRDCE